MVSQIWQLRSEQMGGVWWERRLTCQLHQVGIGDGALIQLILTAGTKAKATSVSTPF